MTKKEFIQMCDYHQYTSRGNREDNIGAVFFDRNQNGNKYCVYARICLTGKKVLIDTLWDFITEKIDDTPYYIQLVVAETEDQRFKIPINSGGLRSLLYQNVRLLNQNVRRDAKI